MRTSSVAATIGLVVCATLVASPAHAGPPGHRPPPAPGPVCGAVLTADTRLANDLTCEGGDGLVLAAGVTLDLRGHTLRGPGGGTGVVVPAQGDVTIRNGTLTGWGSGVGVAASVDEEGQGGDVVVDKVTVKGNQRGIAADGDLPYAPSKDFLVQRSTLARNDTAIHTLFGSVHVTGSTLKDNRVGLDADTSGVLVEGSRIERNSSGVTCYEAGCILRRVEVVGNEVGVDAGFFGVDVADSRLSRNGVAFRSSAYLGAGSLERNRFTDNGTAVELTRTTVSAVGNEFRGNEVAFASSEAAEEGGSTLVGNRFVRNGDAVVIQEPGSSLQDNVAERNRGWGIYAPGAVDLGGNRAWGNGNEPQCVGVVCDGGSGPRS